MRVEGDRPLVADDGEVDNSAFHGFMNPSPIGLGLPPMSSSTDDHNDVIDIVEYIGQDHQIPDTFTDMDALGEALDVRNRSMSDAINDNDLVNNDNDDDDNVNGDEEDADDCDSLWFANLATCDKCECDERDSENMQIVPADSTEEATHNVFMEAFLQNNRLEHVSQVMGYHPDYLRTFLAAQTFLMKDDGPLPFEYRHYIAIMAAARHHCTYLVKLHEHDFLLHNGNPDWLKGIGYAPRKLQDLYEINKILAHRPWLITQGHMEKLLKGPEPWSLSELMHGIILLTHFHSLCSFTYGCGINSEIDMGGFSYHHNRISCGSEDSDSGDSSDLACADTFASNEENSMGVDALLKKMDVLRQNAAEETEEELIKRFKFVEHQNAEILVPSTKKASPKAEILRYVKDPDFYYTDFAIRDQVSDVPTFRARDYSWDDHGFSLANRLYAEVGNVLDDKFTMASNLTYYTMGDNQGVDTASFRRAIWNYIHCMYGIRHDDYDYSEVNHLLERNLKTYMKTLTCYPERLLKKDYEGVMREFKHSEKVHVNLMLMEAKQQAELLYALRALNRYMT